MLLRFGRLRCLCTYAGRPTWPRIWLDKRQAGSGHAPHRIRGRGFRLWPAAQVVQPPSTQTATKMPQPDAVDWTRARSVGGLARSRIPGGLMPPGHGGRTPLTRPARCCEHATPSHDLPQETTVAARRGFPSIAVQVPPNSLKAVERAFYNRGCPGRSSSNVRTTVSTTRRTESRRSAELRPASVRRRMFSTACDGCRVLIVVEAFRLT